MGRFGAAFLLCAAPCVAALTFPTPTGAKFPTPEVHPVEVTMAHLAALRRRDADNVFKLFSRAQRLAIEDSVRRDVREKRPPPEKLHDTVIDMLEDSCPGLLGHDTSEIVTALSDPAPKPGLLPKSVVRVRVDEARHFVFTLTRQSGYDGGDARDCDGYERCWFVLQIKPDDGRGDGDGASSGPPELTARL